MAFEKINTINSIIESRGNLPYIETPLKKCDEEGGCGVTGFISNIPIKGRHIYEPSIQMHNRGNGKGGVCALQHPNNHRRLTVRESAVIQTFPDYFFFYGKLNSMYRQVGNAVPVAFAKRLGEQLSLIEDELS